MRTEGVRASGAGAREAHFDLGAEIQHLADGFGGAQVPTAAEPSDKTPGQQGSLDSHHHFVLDIRGATAGTRGQMVAANGPARATVKTSSLTTKPPAS
jgi:hypothetical protein